MRRFALVVGMLALCMGTPVLGVPTGVPSLIPTLSLDIASGRYDLSSGTTIATDSSFTLYALFNTTAARASGTYYISAAIVPKTENPPLADFGSFTVNGRPYSADNMIWGNPPASVVDKELALLPHGIFDTHYYEIDFSFDTSKRADLYFSPLGELQKNPQGAMLFEDFEVDVSGLSAGYSVHFDLYNIGTDKRGEPMVKDYAPFIFDAQSGESRPLTVADTSSTMILLGMAMLAIEGLRRRVVR